MKLKILKKIKDLFKKEVELKYPSDFAIIDFSEQAQKLGVRDNKNKIITRFFINEFGKVEIKRYRYSQEREHTLKEVHKIPIHDRTKQKIIYPVYARILPEEINFTYR